MQFTVCAPNLFQPPSYFPPLHSGSPHLFFSFFFFRIYFFHPFYGAEGVFTTQLWQGQDGTTSVGTTRPWLPSVSDQALAVKPTTEVLI